MNLGSLQKKGMKRLISQDENASEVTAKGQERSAKDFTNILNYAKGQELTAKDLTNISKYITGKVIKPCNMKINPSSSAFTDVKNAHCHFCQGCVEKVATSITEGLEASQKEILLSDAMIAAVEFLRKINLRVADNVLIEVINKEGMEMAMESNVFGGTPASIIRCVEESAGTPDILKNVLGQEIFPGLLATGVVYDTEKQHYGESLSDHCRMTIGELLEKSVEGGPCNCMWSEEGRKVFEEDCKNVKKVFSAHEKFEMNYAGLETIFIQVDEEKVEFSHNETTTPANESLTMAASADSEGTSDYGNKTEKESDRYEACDSGMSCNDSTSSHYEEESDCESEGEEETDEEDEKRIRVENHHFRPSYIPRESIEDCNTTRLCLSLCKHSECHIDSANKTNIFKCIVFTDKDDNILKNTIPQEEETVQESVVLVKINGEEHMVDFARNAQPSFSLGTTFYELFAYEVSGRIRFWEHKKENMITAVDDDKRYDLAIDQGLGEDAARASNVFCGQKFSKPCSKLYMAINTTATPWPCVIRTPPASEILKNTDYGSFTSFVIPLPSTFTGRSDSPSKHWRSCLYSTLALDTLESSFKPQTKEMSEDNYDHRNSFKDNDDICSRNNPQQWTFNPRMPNTTVKILGSVVNNHIAGDEATWATGLYYCPNLNCKKQVGVEARYDYDQLVELLEFTKTQVNKFTMGKYKNEIQNNNQEENLIQLSEILVKYNNYISKLENQLTYMSRLCTKYVNGYSIQAM